MITEKLSSSRPTPVTRMFTATQWMITGYLLYISLGSGLVLTISWLTSLLNETLLFWHPQFLPVTAMGAVVLSALCGAYWPVFNGESRQRETALLTSRYDCVKWLSVGLLFVAPLSLIDVYTVAGWLLNVCLLGSTLLAIAYAYAYDIGPMPESAS